MGCCSSFRLRYIEPVVSLIVATTNIVLFVAQISEINRLLRHAYNLLQYEYAAHGSFLDALPWQYSPLWLTNAVSDIVSHRALRNVAKGLRGWRAAALADSVLVVSNRFHSADSFLAQQLHKMVIPQAYRQLHEPSAYRFLRELVSATGELPSSFFLSGIKRGERLGENDRWAWYSGMWRRTAVLIHEPKLLEAGEERDEALKVRAAFPMKRMRCSLIRILHESRIDAENARFSTMQSAPDWTHGDAARCSYRPPH